MKNIRLFFISLFLSAGTSVLAGVEAVPQPAPTPAEENHRDLFDYGGTDNGLPDHLQTVHALLALEYVVHDHAGAGIEIDPGPYFQNDIRGDSIDVPWKVWVTFPLKKDKIFAVIGAGGAINQSPVV